MNKFTSLLQKKSWLIFLIVFYAFYCLWIFQYSYVTGSYISSDATGYLHEAEALVHGYGFNFIGAAGGYSWFAAFPIGYPALIALLAMILNPLNTFLCSKLLSMLLIGVILLFFAIRFKEDSWIYALLLLNFGIVHIYTNTWSETAFIPALLFFSLSISKVTTSEECRIRDYVLLYITIIATFLFRYFGIFVLIFSGLVWIYFLIVYIRRRHDGDKTLLRKLIALAVTGICCAITEAAYLFMNLKLNGYATGVPRTEMTDDLKALRMNLYQAIQQEILHTVYKQESVIFNYYTAWAGCIFMIMVFGLLIYVLFRHRKADEPAIFILVGIFYYIMFVIVRFNSSMNNFDYRFFAPASLLILIGLVTIYRENLNSLPLRATRNILCFALLLGVLSVISTDAQMNTEYTAYNVLRMNVLNEYREVPPRSCILNNSASYEGIYFREDLDVNTIIGYTETWDEMMNRLSCYENVCIKKEDAQFAIDSGYFSDSVCEHLQDALNADNTDSVYLNLTQR